MKKLFLLDEVFLKKGIQIDPFAQPRSHVGYARRRLILLLMIGFFFFQKTTAMANPSENPQPQTVLETLEAVADAAGSPRASS